MVADNLDRSKHAHLRATHDHTILIARGAREKARLYQF